MLIKLTQISKMIKPNTIFFYDMDGTLIDTDYANFLAYKQAIEHVTKKEVELTFKPNERFTRNQLYDIVRDLTSGQYVEIIKAKELFYKTNVSNVKMNSSLLTILHKTATTHKSYIVTNATKDRATYTLNYTGVVNQFESIISIEEDDEKLGNKYLLAISKLKVDPAFVVVFENEDKEIANAMQAGILKSNIVKI